MKESYQTAIELYEAAVRAGAPANRCHCCGATVAEGVKGCFELFSNVIMRGYSDPRNGAATFYGVDAHALQHPEIHGKKNNAAHLLRLCWIMERGAHPSSREVPAWWQRYTARSDIPIKRELLRRSYGVTTAQGPPAVAGEGSAGLSHYRVYGFPLRKTPICGTLVLTAASAGQLLLWEPHVDKR